VIYGSKGTLSKPVEFVGLVFTGHVHPVDMAMRSPNQNVNLVLSVDDWLYTRI